VSADRDADVVAVGDDAVRVGLADDDLVDLVMAEGSFDASRPDRRCPHHGIVS
jgi:hypothetical protein